MLVEEAFRRHGYQVEEIGLGGADGEIDLRLRKDGQLTLVQGKQWRTRSVDVKLARETYGLLAHHRADGIKVVAMGDFTPEAREFVRGKPVELISGRALFDLIREVKPERSAPRVDVPAMKVPIAGAPLCPNCGADDAAGES